MHARHALLFGVLCVLYAAACAQTTTNTTDPDSGIDANETSPNKHMIVSHGWLMCTSTMVLVPVGMVTQRFLSPVCGVDKRIALGLHISVFIIAVILETVGLIIGATYSNGGQGYGAHKTMGYVAYSMLLLSNVLGFLRTQSHPPQEAPEDAEDTTCYAHRAIGILTILCGAYSVFTGKSTLSDIGYGDAADVITYFGFGFQGLLIPTMITCACILRRRKRKQAKEDAENPDTASLLRAGAMQPVQFGTHHVNAVSR
eukprot:TRINITY_DN1804_c0_g1_i12.p1 TRINITY_DN1804_c0_g1~~TRINITY_DN1804_c0_g1_i12.p1  ORF type:complete len:257 (+),score=72.82 TRINITY_DN1804_c0_g1_i12:369-1139(+)